MLDYILVVAIGISAGVGALVSAVPLLQPYTLWLCLVILALIAIVNLRGVREAGLAFVLPTYLFIACMVIVLAIGLVKTWLSGGQPLPVDLPPRRQHWRSACGYCYLPFPVDVPPRRVSKRSVMGCQSFASRQ